MAFRLEKRLVCVAVRALDNAGQPLHGLAVDDFTILENDRARQPESVAQDELALDLALVLDVSHSMGKALRQLADGAREALRTLRPGDRVAVFTFARRPRLDLPLTADLSRVDATLEEVARGNSRSATVLYTPIHRAAQYLAEQPEKNRRRAVLIVSDAKGFPGESERETLSALWEADSSAHLLLSGAKRNRAGKLKHPTSGTFLLADLPKLIEKAGGETMALEDRGNSFADLLARIRAQHSVCYTPADGAGLRKVAVRLSDAAQVRLPGSRAIGRKEFRLP